MNELYCLVSSCYYIQEDYIIIYENSGHKKMKMSLGAVVIDHFFDEVMKRNVGAPPQEASGFGGIATELFDFCGAEIMG